jgi:hypothetical protein
MGGHETVEPRPSVSSYRQKFMHLGLDPSRHGQIVARGKGSRGRTARGQTESTKPHGPAKFGGRPVLARRSRVDAHSATRVSQESPSGSYRCT